MRASDGPMSLGEREKLVAMRRQHQSQCQDCEDKDAIIAYLEGRVVALHAQLGHYDQDTPPLDPCIVCGEEYGWPETGGLCVQCAEDRDAAAATEN